MRVTRAIRRPARATLAVTAALLTAVSLTGCQKTSPRQTDVAYAPADGVEVTLGQVKVNNLGIVADSADARGVLIGQVFNGSGDNVTVTFSDASGGSTAVQVPGMSQVSLSDKGATVAKAGGNPGTMVKVGVATGTSGQQEPLVPVLMAEGYYATVTPTAEATATPTATAGPASETAAPTASGTATATPTP